MGRGCRAVAQHGQGARPFFLVPRATPFGSGRRDPPLRPLDRPHSSPSSVDPVPSAPGTSLRDWPLHRLPRPGQRPPQRAGLPIRAAGRLDHDRERLALADLGPPRSDRPHQARGRRQLAWAEAAGVGHSTLPTIRPKARRHRSAPYGSRFPGALGPSVERTPEVVVIGAGRAGRAVAASLVARGVRPVVLERGLHPPPMAGAELLGATTAVFLPPPVEVGERRFTLLAFREPAQGVRIDARSVVIATGGYDASLLFGGNDRPGVVTADAALSLVAPSRPPPFHQAVVVGGGRRAAEVLEACGDAVEAVVSARRDPPRCRPGRERPRHSAVPALSLAPGRWAQARPLGSSPRSKRRNEDHHRLRRGDPRAPEGPARPTVLPSRNDDGVAVGRRAYTPTVSANGATSVPGLFAAGSVAGVSPSEFALHAEIVTDSVVRGADRPDPRLPLLRGRPPLSS